MKLILLALLFPLALMAKNYDGYIVKMKDSHSLKLQNNLSIQLEELKVNFGNYYLIKGNNENGIANFLEELKNNPHVDYVEPNFIMNIDYEKSNIPPETIAGDNFEKQWNLNNTGTNFKRTVFHSGTPGKDIKALKGWELTRK
jgi:thermitase